MVAPRPHAAVVLGVIGVIAIGDVVVHLAHLVLHGPNRHVLRHLRRSPVGVAGERLGRARPAARIVSSVLAVLTMNDPPRFDVRALPLMVGFVAALAGLAGVK